MLVLLLSACGDVDVTDGARARAHAWLDDHPTGTAIVRARLGEEGVEAVVGTRWHGADLAEWLAPCALGDAPFDALLRLEPGHYPWELLDDEGVPACAAERLARFPFEEPSVRADVDVVLVRWRPAEPAPVLTERPDDASRSGVPAGLLALAPPYYRYSPSGNALAFNEIHIERGRVRIPVSDADDVISGPLDDPAAWARQLTCEADQLDLVRVTLVFSRAVIDDYDIWPENECVREKAFASWRWRDEQTIGGVKLRDADRSLVVVDVPVGPW